METHRFNVSIIVLAFLALSLFSVPPVLAQKTGGSGGGNTPPDYGDLFVLYRNSNGVPYVTKEVDVTDPETGEVVMGGLCLQPLPSDACPDICLGTGYPLGDYGVVSVVEVDSLTCSVPAECSICTREVEFERDNVIRAKDSVLDQQGVDATVTLAGAGCVTLDPAGRPVASNLVAEEVISKTIDSPLQNLAFYIQLMKYGYLSTDNYLDRRGEKALTTPRTSTINLPADNYLDNAARALGASAPKEGKVTVDIVVYMNQILGLTEEGVSLLPRTFVDVREEVKGVMTVVRKWFLDFSEYSYNREVNFSTTESSLPYPSYIPDEYGYGNFEYMANVGAGLYEATIAPIYDIIFSKTPASGYDLTGFAQAADDTRAVINFIHNYEVPEEDATPIICDASISDLYDVSISETSGLQVPVRMVAAGDGREGTLTIENNGPATANDIEISVDGKLMDGDVEIDQVELLDEMGGDPILFPVIVDSLDPGYTASISFFFTMDQAGTITWTANANTDDNDVNPANNEVVEYTKVSVPKGSGGGDH